MDCNQLQCFFNFISNLHFLYNTGNKRVEKYLNKTYLKRFSDILKGHVAAYQKYFNRVVLDPGITDAAKLPTDERLKNFNSVNDPQFVTLY